MYNSHKVNTIIDTDINNTNFARDFGLDQLQSVYSTYLHRFCCLGSQSYSILCDQKCKKKLNRHCLMHTQYSYPVDLGMPDYYMI